MEYLNCPRCNEKIEFIDRWNIGHDEGKCSHCQNKFHLLSQIEYEKLTESWNNHQSCESEIKGLKDQLRRRNLQIKDLKGKIKALKGEKFRDPQVQKRYEETI